MGPHVFACGNFDRLKRIDEDVQLQWGRTFLRAEIGKARTAFTLAVALQWGRTFLRAEIRGIHGCVRALDRFNGAARFCVRKWRRSLRDAARRSSASMGPHVFACGNLGIRCSARFARPALQWGRTFLRAEMRATYSVSVDVDRLQWGRTFLRAEIVRYVGRRRSIQAASMGPHVFACGNLSSRGAFGKRRHGFNGAARF